MAGGEEQIVRQLLTAIERDSGVSQRSLSQQIGIAVGSVNWYLNRCVGKGLVKLQQAPVRRYFYYLTPRGFEEKARLSASFLQSSLELFRRGRKECASFFRACADAEKTCVFLAGDGDLAEIAVLSSLNASVRPCAVIEAASDRKLCAGVPVVVSLEAAMSLTGHRPDAILLTSLADPEGAYQRLRQELDVLRLAADIVAIPKLLQFRPTHA